MSADNYIEIREFKDGWRWKHGSASCDPFVDSDFDGLTAFATLEEAWKASDDEYEWTEYGTSVVRLNDREPAMPDLAARIAHLEAVNAKLLAACEAVEWVGLPFFVEHEWICAVCQRRKSEGHAPDCQLDAAIREGRAAE